MTPMATTFGSTSYEYDLLDRLTRVVDRNGYATAYEYDKNGNRTRVTYANGYTTTYDYDLLNRLIRQETLDNDGGTVVQYVYTLGAAGERKAVSEIDRTVEYTYDNLYRLTSETITEGEKVTTYTYAYDNVSNRILKTVDGEETVYTYNALNQLLTEGEITYEYDLNGNTVRMISAEKTALYVYNADNRLIRSTVQSGNNVSVEEYKYDYAGNRIAKSSEGEYTKYLLDVNGSLAYVLAEMDYDGTEKCFYTRGTDLVSQERDGKKSYYVYDGHGSVRALFNEDGKVTDKYTYDAFGNLISSVGSTKNDFLFAGEQFDPVTGLYYLRARYMNPSIGTFISMDSYDGSIDDPVSLHKYLYANANPVSNSDPSGYMTKTETTVGVFIQNALRELITPNYKAITSFIAEISDVIIISANYLLIKFFIINYCKEIAAGTYIEKSLVDDFAKVKPINISEAERKDTGSPRIYSVYYLADDTGQIAYVGRTKNMEERMRAHDKTSRGRLHLVTYVTGLTYKECRWVEQAGIIGFNTLYDPKVNGSKDDYVGNKIRGIRVENEKKYIDYGISIARIVYNEITNEILNAKEGGLT